MKGRIVRIDKTARQKGAPSWLKELIYVDEVDDAKPAREGGTRSDSLLKANATHPTTCDGGPKGIATYPSNSEGNVLNEPAETGEKNFDTCNDELEIAAESECDLVFFSLRRIAEKISSAVAKNARLAFLRSYGPLDGRDEFLRRNHDGACLLKGDFSAILRGGSVR